MRLKVKAPWILLWQTRCSSNEKCLLQCLHQRYILRFAADGMASVPASESGVCCHLGLLNCSHAHSIARTPSNEENFCGYELNQIGEDKGSILGKLGEDTQCAGLSFTSHSFFVPTRSMWSE